MISVGEGDTSIEVDYGYITTSLKIMPLKSRLFENIFICVKREFPLEKRFYSF